MGLLNSSLGIGHTILLIDDSNLEFQSHNNQLKSKYLVSILPSKKKTSHSFHKGFTKGILPKQGARTGKLNTTIRKIRSPILHRLPTSWASAMTHVSRRMFHIPTQTLIRSLCGVIVVGLIALTCKTPGL